MVEEDLYLAKPVKFKDLLNGPIAPYIELTWIISQAPEVRIKHMNSQSWLTQQNKHISRVIELDWPKKMLIPFKEILGIDLQDSFGST